MFESIPQPIKYPEKPGEQVSSDYYYRVMAGIFENIGKDSPLHQMASELCDKLSIPNGPTSALTTRRNSDTGEMVERTEEDKKKDRIIGTVFRDIPGVYVGMGENENHDKVPVVTMDINRILDVLEEGREGFEFGFQDFLNSLPEKDRKIIEGERLFRVEKKKQFGRTESIVEKNKPLVYFRLPGGVGVFLRGYVHHKTWQENYGNDLVDIYAKDSSLVVVEGFADVPLGESLPIQWKGENHEYDDLIRGIGEKNGAILFGEVDGRDKSVVEMERGYYNGFLHLPPEFYSNFYYYLNKINPKFTETIESVYDLKELLKLQSSSVEALIMSTFSIKDNMNVEMSIDTKIDKIRQALPHMTGFELGRNIYTDALSAVKLHLLAKLSNDDNLPNGPIIDFQGSGHIFGKTFFMQYPQYALMVVLMNIHELMAGHAKKIGSNDDTVLQYSREIFLNPNWEDVIGEILKLPIFSIEVDPSKTTQVGKNQKELIDQSPDYALMYGIDIATLAQKLKDFFESEY